MGSSQRDRREEKSTEEEGGQPQQLSLRSRKAMHSPTWPKKLKGGTGNNQGGAGCSTKYWKGGRKGETPTLLDNTKKTNRQALLV